MADAVVSGVGVEATNTGEPDAVVSTVGVEATNTGAPDAVVSTAGVEAVNTGAPDASVSDVAVEAVNTGAPLAAVTTLGAEAVNTGAPLAAVTLVGIEVWRSIALAHPELFFPYRLFRPPTLMAKLAGGTVIGGADLASNVNIERLDAGATWVLEFGEAAYWNRDKMLAARQFAAAADLGTRPIVVPLWDRRHQPFEVAKYEGDDPTGTVIWDDPIRWRPEGVFARVAVSAPTLSTRLSFLYQNALRPQAGEHFSIRGRRKAWRLYRIVRIVSDIDGVVTAEIRPPLREYANSGEELNFDSPRCTMRLDGDVEPLLELLRFGSGSARFVETFSRFSDQRL